MSINKFQENLLSVFETCINNKEFSSSLFFSKWFKDNGTAYFFLFKKNLAVTNIQFAELLSLLKTHICETGVEKSIQELQFLSKSEFTQILQEIVNVFPMNEENGVSKYKLIVELYSSLLRRIVVIDSFHGSCAIYLPPHLSLDIPSICAEAGYIHSAGRNIFIRNMSKISKKEFFDAMDEYLTKLDKNKKLFFVAYAHEDFTQYDRRFASELRGGLDETKIFVEKLYMGAERFVNVLKEMQQIYKNYLVIPNPGNYKTIHNIFRKRSDVDVTRTIWLITDHAIGKELRHPGDESYIIVYDQEFMNQNPFHIFDENKPAWVDHTTIPHTLAGAMINITRPWSTNNAKVMLADPFVGTGTIWLESLKYQDVITCCSDLNPLSSILAEDNLRFFALSPDQLDVYLTKLDDLKNCLEQSKSSSPSSENKIDPLIEKGYLWAFDFIKKIEKTAPQNDIDSVSFNSKQAKELKAKYFLERLLFYVALRTTRRNAAAFARASKDWVTAYLNELAVLTMQIKSLYDLRLKEAGGVKKNFRAISIIIQSDYSLSTSISYARLKQGVDNNLQSSIKINDARKLAKNSCDIIITDPPYGFNTSDRPEELAKLYENAIRVMIDALRDNGQLVICVPDESKTGRRLSFFTNKGLIIQQVLAACEEANREVFNSAYVVPPPSTLFRAPYYWESERALRRAILHFRIRSVK